MQVLRLNKDQKKKDWKDPDKVDVVTIMYSANKTKPTIKACKKIFNATHPKDLGNRPGGISAKLYPWFADRDSLNPTREQRNHESIARYKQKNWAKKVVRITLDAVQNLHLPIEHLGNQVTLRQALIYCRTSAMGEFCLFSSVNYIPNLGECIAIWTSTSERETDSVIENLIPLCREHFGPSVKYWFTDEAWQENIHRSYNHQTRTIDEDVAYENSDRALLLSAFGLDLECSDSSSIDSDSDLETNSADALPPTCILPHLFQLTPSEHGAIDQDNKNSLGTMATGTSNATRYIADDSDKADIDFTCGNTTVISTLTEKTNMASPLFKSPTGNNEHSSNSGPGQERP